MARYYVPADHDLATVAQELLDAAHDQRAVIYLPGEGPNGAFDLPDDLADSYASKQAAKVRADTDANDQALRDAYAAAVYLPGPKEPTLEDQRAEGQKTNSVAGTYSTPEAPIRTRTSRRAKTSAEE